MANPKRKNPQSTAISYYESSGDTYPDVSAANPLPIAIISGAGSGGTAMTDDAAFTVGTTSVTPVAGTYRVTRDSVNDGDGGALAMTATRALLTAIETPNGDSAMDDTNDALRVNIVAGSSSGTEYTEDAAAAANPAGPAVILVRQDTPSALVSTDGDNVAQRGTNYGAAYTQIVTSAGAFVDTFGGGAQYTEGDTDASITGTAMMMEVAADTLQPVQGTVADGLLVNLGANNDVAVSSSALPTGAATSAKQDTIIGHVDGIEALLTTIDSDTSTLAVVGGGTEATAQRVTIASDSTGVLSIDDNGGSITVDGTVAATIAAGATTIAKAEDVASADADVGVPAMAVRKATPANTSGTDGDYEMLQMSAGRLWTSATVDAALPAGTNTIGGTVPNASASGTGLSVSKTDAQTATVTAVKAGSGRVYGYHIYNPNAFPAFFHFYNIASGSVTVGTSTRTMTLWIPGEGAIDGLFSIPISFDTAISQAATTTITGSTAPATGLLVDVFYI